MKIRQLVFWVISLSFWFIFTTCEKDKDEPTGKFKVEITDLTVSQIKYKHAALIARVEVSGNHEIGSHGFCYSPEPAPDKSDSLVNLGRFTAEESFSASIERLLPATRYYFRAFVDLPGGTIFSKEVSFTTLKTGKPSIQTDSVSSLTSGSAIFNATILSDSGLVVTGRGFTWGQHAVPGMMDSIREIDTPADNFSLNLTGLEAATTYYVQAFASNEAGTSFGNLLEFITLPEIPVVITGEAADLTTNSATCSGEVNTDGGAQVISRGTCWSTSENPTIFSSHTSDGAGTGLFTSYLGNLSSGTKYYYRAYATNSAGTAYGNQRSFLTLSDPVLPTVSTGEVTNITTTYALSGGNVLSDGGLAVTARGLCWSIKPGPSLKDTYSTDGSGTGSFITNIINLAPGTKYYVRAYATNSLGTAYGNEVSFTTETVHTVPTVTTTAATAVTSGSAVSGGNVTNTGGDAVTARGVCWSTSQNPTITNSHTIDGSGSGAYSSNITGLTASTTYYVRAYATNISGTAYGNQISFTTSAAVTLPSLTTAGISSISSNSAVSGGTISSDGGASVTARGVCWSINQNPTISNAHTTDGTGTGTFTSNITGLNASTTYYVRAYATNSAGTAYGDQKSFTTSPSATVPSVTTANVTNITSTTAISGGNVTSTGGAAVTLRGVCWSTSQNPTIFNAHTSDGSGTGSFVSSLEGLLPSTTYYIRAYATNSQGTAYGNQLSFTTSPTITIPTVTTASVTNITSSTATSGGNVTASGGAAVSARGVCWSTSQNPTLSDSHTTDGSGTGSFVSNLSGLSPSTTYYVRAYATNSQGTAYGNEASFVTNVNEFICGVSTVTDSDGNIYNTVQIENQCWMAENIKVGTFINSTVGQTNNGLTEKYCYQNDPGNCDTYGGLYQWDESMNYTSAPGSQGVCMEGWRIPMYGEWVELINHLGGASLAGGPLKEVGIVHWNSPNTGATNLSNFTALPGGHYHEDYSGIGTSGIFSSSTEYDISQSYYFTLKYNNTNVANYGGYKTSARSVRCIKNNSNAILPSVLTGNVSSITNNSCLCGGEVTHSGNSVVNARGVCWSTMTSPTLDDFYTVDGSGTGPFTSVISGLVPNTTYYIRAYASNVVGTFYGNELSFTTTASGFVCGNILTISHIAGEVAPVSKTVNYGTVETNLTGSNKCWITQNLGADRQALSATDNTEASSGWYWQFNREQGYKHDGTNRTPNTTWTSMGYVTDWLPSNDPCAILLGSEWRLPTGTEWGNADATGGWDNYNETFGSVLKLHTAGSLNYSDGMLVGRGSSGEFWSSSNILPDGAWYLYFSNGISAMGYIDNWDYGMTLRCLRD
ncbi:hypothetical protein SDC9_27649 [bioreactor metagenome]|uniref:Fibronectin type-III domain-containing protein n=2 Tax=root TaxID=1 RepID=A0A644URR3_9ZZZZ